MTLGDKLAKLRKEHNYTQEEFAELLGVSRQAVSRWESDIAYPETDRLIKLSELYGCSVDYLLKRCPDDESIDKRSTLENAEAHAEDEQSDNNAITVTPKDQKIISAATGATVIGSVVIYLILGLTIRAWHPSWIIFLLIPVVSSLADAIIKRKANHFAYPVLATAVYLLIGFITGSWHPSWIIFLTIPLYYIIADVIPTNINSNIN